MQHSPGFLGPVPAVFALAAPTVSALAGFALTPPVRFAMIKVTWIWEDVGCAG